MHFQFYYGRRSAGWPTAIEIHGTLYKSVLPPNLGGLLAIITKLCHMFDGDCSL